MENIQRHSDGDVADRVEALAATVRSIQAELKRTLDVNRYDLIGLERDAKALRAIIEVQGALPGGEYFVGDLNVDLESMRSRVGMNDDVIIRDFNVGGKQNLRAALVFLDGLTDKDLIHEQVMKPLMLLNQSLLTFDEPIEPEHYYELVRNHTLTVSGITSTDSLDVCTDHILEGDTLLIVDGLNRGILLATRGWDERSIDEPATESVIRGSRDGFTETLRTNTMLVRRRLKDPHFRVKKFHVGRRTRTEVAVCYIEGVANPHLVKEVKRRIEAIDIDGVLESGYIEQIIEDDKLSPFPQIQNTERPAKMVAQLLEGRIGVIVDGTPFALVMPATFNQFYQSPEDYNERWIIGTLIRFIRVIAFFSSLTFTSLYVALISFHPEMLPTRFAVAVAGGRSGIPFPSIVEALLMETTMEVLREASLRLPKPIGPTISIVGALVIGEAAVRAGIVSPLMVIVVATTTIGSFAIPSFNAAIALRILKFPIIIAAGIFGLYGVMITLILVTMHLCSLKSIGIPYLTPFAPLRLEDINDTVVRLPFNIMHKRPLSLRQPDRRRLPHEIEIVQGMQDKPDREEK